MSVDRIENLTRQFFYFEQMAKLEQRRRVRRRLESQVNANERMNGLVVVDRIFDAFVRQTTALLDDVHKQYPYQAYRRTTGAYNLRIERFDQFVQLAPRCDAVDLSEETVSPRELFLGGVFEVGEAHSHDQWHAGNLAFRLQHRREREQPN